MRFGWLVQRGRMAGGTVRVSSASTWVDSLDAALLRKIEGNRIWTFRRHTGGETELIEKLLPAGAPEDLQPLGNCCQDVYVFHNEWKVAPIPMLSPTTHRCGLDGHGS